jgi:hypothetical protein
MRTEFVFMAMPFSGGEPIHQVILPLAAGVEIDF